MHSVPEQATVLEDQSATYWQMIAIPWLELCSEAAGTLWPWEGTCLSKQVLSPCHGRLSQGPHPLQPLPNRAEANA